jgi:hypothetical protein
MTTRFIQFIVPLCHDYQIYSSYWSAMSWLQDLFKLLVCYVMTTRFIQVIFRYVMTTRFIQVIGLLCHDYQIYSSYWSAMSWLPDLFKLLVHYVMTTRFIQVIVPLCHDYQIYSSYRSAMSWLPDLFKLLFRYVKTTRFIQVIVPLCHDYQIYSCYFGRECSHRYNKLTSKIPSLGQLSRNLKTWCGYKGKKPTLVNLGS